MQAGRVGAAVALAAAMAVWTGTAGANVPAPEGGGGASRKVRTLKPWKARHVYRVQASFKVRTEPSRLAPRTGVLIARGTWLHIACQVRAAGELWARVAGGFVPDAVMKTYTDGRLQGAPKCRLAHPEHVWRLKPWKPRFEYRSTEAQSPQAEPRLGTGLGTIVEDGQWLRIVCQTRGRRVRGSRIWNRVHVGGYIPDATMKTFTDGFLPKAPRCKNVRQPKPKFVALGDSYSSGLGGDGYFPASAPHALVYKHDYFEGEPPGRKKQCFRNRHAYSRLLARRQRAPRVSGPQFFLACQGDKTGEVLALQIPHIPANTRLVTLTIGGNDMGFSDIVIACATPGRSCGGAVEDHFGRNLEKLHELGPKLDRVYWRIREKAPYATVIVIGYPKLFAPAAQVSECGGLNADDGRLLNSAGALLNRTIGQAVGRHSGFRFVGLGDRFDGHGPCQRNGPRMWINPITAAGERKPFSMHPNLRGQREIAAAVAAANRDLFR